MIIFNKTTLLIISLLTSLFTTSIYCMDIFEAAITGNNERIKELIAAHIDVNQKDTDGSAPLHIAAMHERQAVVQTLITAGANVNQKEGIGTEWWDNDDFAWTPLHYAAANGFLPIAQILIAAGANVNQKDSGGWPPLHYAAIHGNQEIVNLINRVNSAPNTANKQLVALLCAGHPRLGAASPAQPVVTTNGVLQLIVPLVRQAAFEDALYNEHRRMVAPQTALDNGAHPQQRHHNGCTIS